jgi:hypothetical protein
LLRRQSENELRWLHESGSGTKRTSATGPTMSVPGGQSRPRSRTARLPKLTPRDQPSVAGGACLVTPAPQLPLKHRYEPGPIGACLIRMRLIRCLAGKKCWASGPHDFAVRFGIVRSARRRSWRRGSTKGGVTRHSIVVPANAGTHNPGSHCVALSRNRLRVLRLTTNDTAYGSRRSQGRR